MELETCVNAKENVNGIFSSYGTGDIISWYGVSRHVVLGEYYVELLR